MKNKSNRKLKKRIEKLPKWRLKKPRHVGKLDDRHPMMLRQLKDRGFGDDELWNLHVTIVEFSLPRLLAFRESMPFEEDYAREFRLEIDKIIEAFELILDGDRYEPKDIKKVEEGLKAFKKNFLRLWN